MKQRNNLSTQKFIRRILLALLALLILFITTTAFMIFWRGSTKDIEAVAGQFRPPASWKLESQLVRPPAIVCLDGGTCPELSRIWAIDGRITKQQFTSLIYDAGWQFSVDSECSMPNNVSGVDVGVCAASGIYQHYKIALAVSEDSTSHQQRLAIDIRPAN